MQEREGGGGEVGGVGRGVPTPKIVGRGIDPTRACWQDLSAFGSLCSPPRALPTETKVESGTSQIKSGKSVNLSKSGMQEREGVGGEEGGGGGGVMPTLKTSTQNPKSDTRNLEV